MRQDWSGAAVTAGAISPATFGDTATTVIMALCYCYTDGYNATTEETMAQLNIRVGDDTRELLDALARARGLSASELVRDLVDTALGRADPGRSSADTTPPSLSAIERLQLAKLHEILAHLTAVEGEPGDGAESTYHRRMIEVLKRGYTAEYPDVFTGIEPELTRRESSFVTDTLTMFTNLQQSLGGLSATERASLGDHADHALTFGGFDHNDPVESRLASYAGYLISTERWQSMEKHFDAKHEHGNSHAPTLATYQRMLSAWRPLRDQKIRSYGGPNRYLLSAEELRNVVAAWPYPKG